MSSQKIISGSVQKNNGSTILNGGNVASTVDTNALTLAETTVSDQTGGPKIISNQTKKILSGGTFKSTQPMVDGVYIGRTYGNMEIAGTASNLLKSGSDVTRRSYHTAFRQEAVGITDVSAFTGTVTYDAGKQGSGVQFIDPATGSQIDFEAFPTDAVPGELVYMVKGIDPTQANYEKRTG